MSKKSNIAPDDKKDGLLAPVSRFVAYVEEARNELRKVSWPTVRETRSATLVVLGFVTVMSILLGLVDLGLSSLVKLILS